MEDFLVVILFVGAFLSVVYWGRKYLNSRKGKNNVGGGTKGPDLPKKPTGPDQK